jgi:hypothetical protein
MNVDLAQELLNELGSSLENLEKQHGALLQLLKEKGIVTDAQLAPYLAQSGKASKVRWLGTRIRLEHLISAEKQREEKLAEEQKKAANAQAPAQAHPEEAKSKNDEGNGESKPQPEATSTDSATENAGSKSDSKKGSEQHQGATSEDKKSSPKQEKNDA